MLGDFMGINEKKEKKHHMPQNMINHNYTGISKLEIWQQQCLPAYTRRLFCCSHYPLNSTHRRRSHRAPDGPSVVPLLLPQQTECPSPPQLWQENKNLNLGFFFLSCVNSLPLFSNYFSAKHFICTKYLTNHQPSFTGMPQSSPRSTTVFVISISLYIILLQNMLFKRACSED